MSKIVNANFIFDILEWFCQRTNFICHIRFRFRRTFSSSSTWNPNVLNDSCFVLVQAEIKPKNEMFDSQWTDDDDVKTKEIKTRNIIITFRRNSSDEIEYDNQFFIYVICATKSRMNNVKNSIAKSSFFSDCFYILLLICFYVIFFCFYSRWLRLTPIQDLKQNHWQPSAYCSDAFTQITADRKCAEKKIVVLRLQSIKARARATWF